MTNEQQQNGNTGALAPPPIPAWIEASLFEPTFKEIYPDFKQTKTFRARPALAAGENYATVMLRLEAELELKDGSSKKVSLMLKSAHDNEVFRQMMKSHNIFDIEAEMYQNVVPELEQLYRDAGLDIKFGAKSYELLTENPYILLEDLSVTGFKNMNRTEGLDMDHTHAVLTKLAQWHAASAVRVAIRGPYKQQLLNGYYIQSGREMMKIVFGGMGKIFLNCAKSYDGVAEFYDELTATQMSMVDDIYDALEPDASEFCVLNHGDCWSNNIMFQHDAFGKIKQTFLVDYQLPTYGSPAQDLYYFLLSSTKYELKLKNFDYFIKFYHDQLVEHLKVLGYSKKVPALNDLHIALYKYVVWGYTTVTCAMPAVLLDPNDNASLDNFMNEGDAGVALKIQMFSSPRYRKHMEMILPWLYNRGGIKSC